MHPTIRRAVLETALDAAAASALAVAVVVTMTGGAQLSLFGVSWRAHDVWRPLTIGLAAMLARLAVGWIASAGAWRRATATTLFRVTCAAVLAADIGIVFASLVTSCGGLDSAGYLGAARLFLSGRMTELEPVARVLPITNPSAAVAPLGFVPAAEVFHIAPRFPPGLPLVMAFIVAVAGDTAAFYVPPILAIAILPLVYSIARRTVDANVALLATVLVGTNAVFLGMAMQPMSDVPATFWVVLAACCLWRSKPLPVCGGIAAGMALLTRPPLALAAVALGFTTEWPNRRRPVVFTAVTAAFAFALILFQWHIYGHPFTSGYGTAGQLFTLVSFSQNAVLYAKWLLIAHTPLAALAFAAGAFVAPRMAWRAAALFAATAAPYLVYAPRFEDWEILRFLLPALPCVLIVCAVGVAHVARARSHELRMQVIAACVAVAAAIQAYSFLRSQHLTDLWLQEARYPLVGRWFADHTPTNSVAIAALHSGSIRYYSGRPTIRLDALPPGVLARTVGNVRRAGYEPYLVVEQGEELEEYQRRSSGASSVELTPEARIRGVYIFHLTLKP